MAVCICDWLHFSTTTVSIYHKNLSKNRVKSYDCPNLLQHSISTFKLHDILWASIGHLSQNVCPSELARVSLFISWCLHRIPALCGDPEERLSPFVFAKGIIFQQRLSQHIIKIYRTTKSKVMAIQICVGIRFQLSSSVIYYWAQSDIQVKTFACQNFPESSLLVLGRLNRFLDCGSFTVST